MTPESLVKTTHTLFSLPDIVVRINDLIDDPTTRVSDLAEVILCDPALSARLLRLVNSAYYARSNRIESIPHAINLIGQRELRDLVFATAAVNLFQGLPPEQVNMDQFWYQSIACGIAARLLAKRKRLTGGERLFIAGLLHGIGRLIFYSQQPVLYREALRQAQQGDGDLVAAERRIFGFTYADLSAELLKAWRLPELVRVAVAYHLKPAKAPDYGLEARIIQVAARIASDLHPGTGDAAPVEYPSEVIDAFVALLELPGETFSALPGEISLNSLEIFQIIRAGKGMIF
jgi:HD-like signal output (HDOD) protein